MKPKNILTYIAGPTRIFLTVLIILIGVSFLQAIAREAISFFILMKRPPATKSETELTENEKRIERIKNSRKEFTPDGTIHLVYELIRRPFTSNTTAPQIEQIYDINDHLLWEGPSNERPYEYLSWAEDLHRNREVFTARWLKNSQMLIPTFSRNIEIPVGSANKTEEVWRYLPGAEYFVGYNTSGEKIGYLGATGFSESKSKIKRFGEFKRFTTWCPRDSSHPTSLYQTDRCIFEIDFVKRDVELLFESSDSDIEDINLHAWRNLKPDMKSNIISNTYSPLLVCKTRNDKARLILRNPDQQLTFTIPEDWQGWIYNNYQFTATREGIFLVRYWLEGQKRPDDFKDRKLYNQWYREYASKERKFWVELYKMNQGGNLEFVNRYGWIIPTRDKGFRFATRPAHQRFIYSFSPPLYNLIYHALGAKLRSRIFSSAMHSEFFTPLLRGLLWLGSLNPVTNWLISILMMGFVFWHGLPRRISSAWFVFWLVFVGVFNVIGLLTYLALNHTTVIACPACGGRRGLSPVKCVRCKASLPIPKRREVNLICS